MDLPDGAFVGNLLGPIEGGTKLFWCEAPAFYSGNNTAKTKVDDFFGQFAEFALFKGKADMRKPRVLEGVPFEFVFGDLATAAIFSITETPGASRGRLNAKELIATLEMQSIHPAFLLDHLAEIPSSTKPWTYNQHLQSLKTLSSIYHIYEPLTGASIAMSVTSKGLYNANWMPSLVMSGKSERADRTRILDISVAYEPLSLDLASTFACIVMLESGTINLSSVGLGTVMTMSSADSLFIANRLLEDPAHIPQGLITRLRGNIGKAGIALLIPPQNLRSRKIEPSDWNLMDENEFDGRAIDSFQNTSLHMSFTSCVLPIDTGSRGVRDTEIYFLETVISVHDRGEWMGDLDILPIFDN